MAGMRRSEVSALHWADVADAADGDGVLVTVRRSKTNQEGETTDVRFVKGGVARAIRTLRAAANPAPSDRVAPLSPKMVGLRFQAAALGRRRRAGDRPLGAGGAGVGAHEPGRVDHRRDARRELEDEPDGGALLGRGDRRARGCRAVSVTAVERTTVIPGVLQAAQSPHASRTVGCTCKGTTRLASNRMLSRSVRLFEASASRPSKCRPYPWKPSSVHPTSPPPMPTCRPVPPGPTDL